MQHVCVCYSLFFLGVTLFSVNCFKVLDHRFIEQTWIVNITCSLATVVLVNMFFSYSEKHETGLTQRHYHGFRRQLACCGVLNNCII